MGNSNARLSLYAEEIELRVDPPLDGVWALVIKDRRGEVSYQIAVSIVGLQGDANRFADELVRAAQGLITIGNATLREAQS